MGHFREGKARPEPLFNGRLGGSPLHNEWSGRIMDEDEIRLGVIGCGGFGLVCAPAVRPGARREADRHGGDAPRGRTRRRAAVRHPRHRGRRQAPGPRRRRPGLHRDAAVSASSPGDGRARGRQARHLREAAGHDARAGRRHDRVGPEERPAARRQPDAAVQPGLRRRRAV